MFSQRSFRPIEELPPPHSPVQDLTSPFEGEDEFDQLDPRFTPHSRSRASSTADEQVPARVEFNKVRSPTKGAEESVEELDESARAPFPQPYPILPHPPGYRSSQSPSHRADMERYISRAHKENQLEEPESPARVSRASPSPSRPQRLNALSNLQAFSPLISSTQSSDRSLSNSDTNSVGTRSRASSITKSLSRRQSLIAHAATWSAREPYEDPEPLNGAGLFSCLTLVRAPAENTGLKRRSKSVSALAPFSLFAAAADTPATSNRGPRRSFAASSFAGMAPMVPVRSPSSSYSIGGPDAVNRITQLYGTDNDAGVQRKTLTPEEVVEVARALASPVAVPEGGFKRAELKRRRSAGATHRRTQQDPVSPETPPVALEPVEYVQLDEDTLLPFVDRPEEVAELLNHPSNEKMFKSLRAAFPKTPARADWQTLRPEEWNWEEFCWHLTQPSRVECSDYTWVFRARQAVRQRSVALWEKVGVCIGCDGDLLNAGGEDGIPLSWGGLGLGEEGEYDPSANQVYIAALEAVDPAETEKAERDFREEFGDIVEDEGEAAAMRMAALAEKDTMKETEEEARSSGRSTSLRPTKRDSQAQYGELAGNPNQNRPSRSKSFVGLQILTSHSLKPYSSTLRRSPSATQTPRLGASLPIFERGPGSPLFPSSFTSLSVEPNLGRSASVGLAGGFSGGFGVSSMEYGVGGRDKDWAEVSRKPSGAPISESAITFATSESEWSHSDIHHDIHT